MRAFYAGRVRRAVQARALRYAGVDRIGRPEGRLTIGTGPVGPPAATVKHPAGEMECPSIDATH
ncbi:hypothetical protein GCM10027188_04660 [Lysobacter humi (ex Lee et al. 2017)]